ncbi:MAG: segregation/condensation protein A [Syntrophomonadaceae bacterium]|jgi:segregation and condensation protein A|nr:segregation/condensation protein A [Syntrophomonadaceae bacterium]
MEYVVDLDSFHGPLDLLLYLIDENQIDIYDIPIAQITDQYMEYLNLTGDFDLEKLGDFLIMASYLLTLKSQMMLPGKQEEEDEESDHMDPRDELVQRLLDYKKFKMAAEKLERFKNGEGKRAFYREMPTKISLPQELTASADSLKILILDLWEKNKQKQNFFQVPKDDIDVGEQMEVILKLLRKRRDGILFQELFHNIINKKELSALFLALLELMRLQKVKAEQENDFGIIKLYPGRGRKC